MIHFVGVITESGPAAFVPGVPTRDLDLIEWNALTPEQRQLAVASGLYTGAPQTPEVAAEVVNPSEVAEQALPAEPERNEPADDAGQETE